MSSITSSSDVAFALPLPFPDAFPERTAGEDLAVPRAGNGGGGMLLLSSSAFFGLAGAGLATGAKFNVGWNWVSGWRTEQ